MREIFTSPEENNDDKISGRISFDNNNDYSFDDSYNKPIFTPENDDNIIPGSFEDLSSKSETTEATFFNGYTDNLSQGNDQESPYVDNEHNFEAFEIPHESTADEFVQKDKSYLPKIKKDSVKNAKKIMIAAPICILLVLILGLFIMVFNICGKTDYQPDTHIENEYITEDELFSSKKVKNILVISTDERESESTFRSDSMILVSVDKKSNKIKLTSFLRDSYVYIPAKGFSTKLNAACSYGGPQMVIDTIEYNFKVHIDNYVMINFDIFKDIINDLGGVTLTITEEEADCIRRESGKDCESGTNVYNGKLALWYARIRHLDSDFKRTERQRKVFQAVFDKMKKSSPKTLITMMNHVLPSIQTDMNSSTLFSLGLKALPTLRHDFEQMEVPAGGTWYDAYVDGQAVLKLDFDENIQLLKEFIYENNKKEENE